MQWQGGASRWERWDVVSRLDNLVCQSGVKGDVVLLPDVDRSGSLALLLSMSIGRRRAHRHMRFYHFAVLFVPRKFCHSHIG